MASNSTPKISRSPIILFLGFVVLLLAEIMAGSSLQWFLDISGILITIPFYILQVLCFWNLAVYTQRTRPAELYLWGMLLGLCEESWYTKVIFSGATSATTSLFGNFFGFGVVELLILVLFWHPTMTFLSTLCIMEGLASTTGVDNPLRFWIEKTGRNKGRYFILATISAIILTVFAQQNLLAIFAPEVITFVCILIFGIISKKQIQSSEIAEGNPISPLYPLVFSKHGMYVIFLMTILFYIGGFFYFRTFALPSIPTLIITAILYIPIIILLFGKKRANGTNDLIRYEKNRPCFQSKDYLGFFLWFMSFSLIACLIPSGYLGILSWGGYFLYVILGIINFIRVIISRFH